MSNIVLVNDTVRIKVRFFDTDQLTGAEVDVTLVSVNVRVEDSKNLTIIDTDASLLSGSEYYYDFTPLVADQYEVIFTGFLDSSKQIIVKQFLYVSDPDINYRPLVTLKSDETIIFAADVNPLYVDPEEILAYFPDASLLEVGELIHHYSLEVKEMFNYLDSEDGSSLPFVVAEYIKASACCELSRTYGFGGDDEQSIGLADLKITNRSNPRNSINRGNATTWCQIAAALRKEVTTAKVGMRGVSPKGLPSRKVATAGKNVDPQTGAIIYLSDRELYGPGKKATPVDDPMPTRELRRYD
jgi:hypothetical protein